MKKFLVMILAVISTSAFADTVDNEREYSVEKTFDTDIRVIEFTPKGYPHMACIYVTGGNDGGVTCFPKKPELKKVWACKEHNLVTTCKEK